uniref:Uncharacterized protein n=1 Tax=Solanum tuberosum TaxID=4113 RepID=M1DD20_SOLTU
MSEMLPSEQNQESEVWPPISSPPHDHFNNNIQNGESIISESTKDKVVDEIEDQKATKKEKLSTFDLYEMKCVCPKIGEKVKSPMPEFYELKPIGKHAFSNIIQGQTSEIKLKKEDNYDYYQDVAILKSIYHYFFNHGVILYPNYSENFINYIEASIPNLKFHGQTLKSKINMLEKRFLIILRIAVYDPNIINPIHREIWSLWIYGVDLGNYYQVGKEIDETDDNLGNWRALREEKRGGKEKKSSRFVKFLRVWLWISPRIQSYETQVTMINIQRLVDPVKHSESVVESKYFGKDPIEFRGFRVEKRARKIVKHLGKGVELRASQNAPQSVLKFDPWGAVPSRAPQLQF